MGHIFSCRRRARRSSERDPILARDTSTAVFHFSKIAEALGALNAGKYPSQDQINQALRRLLRSELLKTDDLASRAKLSTSGARLLSAFSEDLQVAMEIGLEKNADDVFQQLVYELSQIESSPSVQAELTVRPSDEVHLDGSSELPGAEELTSDTVEILRCMKQLSKLLVTSSIFRILLFDIFITARDITASVAVEVETLANQVDIYAEKVEQAVRHGSLSPEEVRTHIREAGDDMEALAEDKYRHLRVLAAESSFKLKDTILFRVKQIVTTAQQNPLHRQAFQTVIALAQKYADKFAAVDASNPSAFNVTPTIYTDEKTRHVWDLLRVIVERFASGHTVARILDAFYQIILYVINAPGGANGEVRKLCRDLGKWLDQALQQNRYAMSWNGALALEQLYDRGQTIFTSESHSQLSLHCTTLVHEIQSFIDALLSDRSTRRLIDVINNISDALAEFGSAALSSAINATRRRRAGLKHDAFAWLLPRLLATFRTVPVPRVEYKDRFMDVAVDGIFLTSGSVSASLLPDHLAFENWTELRLDTASDQPDGDSNLRTATRMHLHLDGARLSAKGLSYYFLLKGLLGYQDQGTLNIDVGSQDAVGQGITMDVQLEMETELQGREEFSNLSSTEHMSVFRSTNVIVDVPGLSFTIEKSKHWVVNALLMQPLSGPVVRFFIRRIMEEQLRMGIDSLGRLLGKIRDLAQLQAAKRGQKGAPSLDHYWSAVLQSVGVPYGVDISTPEEDAGNSRPDDSQPDAITTTEVSLKGIVHTSLAPKNLDAPETQRSNETVIAVGVGPQVVGNDAGPYSEDLHVSQLSEVVEEVREGIEDVEDITADAVRSATERMGSVKEDLSRMQRLKEARERLEKSRDGWRSGAFDI